VTFVATHSSHVLRGILEMATNVTVIRLTRRNKQFNARLLTQEALDNALRPKTRAEAVLDGIFAKGVVLVESEGDREEYQAAAEALEDFPSREVHTVPVGGTGGFAQPLRFYRLLKIPAAVIADLDTVCDLEKIETICRLLGPGPDDVARNMSALRDLVARIRALPPTVAPEEITADLKGLSEQSWSWDRGDDCVLRRKLNEIEGTLKRIRKLKEGGIAVYQDHPDISARLQELVATFARLGLFFVPVGELEDWVKHLMDDVPKNSTSKTDRAAIAADRIRAAPDKSGDIWDFVREVLTFLRMPSD